MRVTPLEGGTYAIKIDDVDMKSFRADESGGVSVVLHPEAARELMFTVVVGAAHDASHHMKRESRDG